MDEIGKCIDSMSTQGTVEELHLFLDRSLCGRPPLEFDTSPLVSSNCFQNLKYLHIMPASDAKSKPNQELSLHGCHQFFEIFGHFLNYLKITEFKCPYKILNIVTEFCPNLLELEICGSPVIENELFYFCHPKLRVLEISGTHIKLLHEIKLTSLSRLIVGVDTRDSIDVDRACNNIPSQILELVLTIEVLDTCYWIHAISNRFTNLLLLDLHHRIDNYYEISITRSLLKNLSTGCPLLHTFYLPIYANIDYDDAIILSDFPSLIHLFPWSKHETIIARLEEILTKSITLREVIFRGPGPEEVNVEWQDLETENHLQLMIAWHQLREKLNIISSKFVNRFIGLVEDEEAYYEADI